MGNEIGERGGATLVWTEVKGERNKPECRFKKTQNYTTVTFVDLSIYKKPGYDVDMHHDGKFETCLFSSGQI